MTNGVKRMGLQEETGCVLGVDTSNYTTSICLLDRDGRIVYEQRRALSVPKGEHGLMQSAALFQHVVHLSQMISQMRPALCSCSLKAIGVSTKPRSQQGSYMPVFRAGDLAAQSIGVGASVPVIETNHQSGHIMAGLITAKMDVDFGESFLVIHLSGGTTDMLLVTRDHHDFQVQLLASSLDLHVGQYVDRIGVQLGLPFPAGKHLERLARDWEEKELPYLPSAVREGSPSFSGPLSAAQRLHESGIPHAAIAAAVQRSVATTIEKMLRHAFFNTGIKRALLVGGVASNQTIQQRLRKRFGMDATSSGALNFCAPQYASDNAFGVAHIARTALDPWFSK